MYAPKLEACISASFHFGVGKKDMVEVVNIAEVLITTIRRLIIYEVENQIHNKFGYC